MDSTVNKNLSSTNLVLFEITPVFLGVDHESFERVWVTHLEWISTMYGILNRVAGEGKIIKL